MKRKPVRTCIGCRGSFEKEDVVRIVAGASGAVLDYREKLPGRAAYVCPRKDCIEKALSRENLSRALKSRIKPPSTADFTSLLITSITEKVKSLLAMAVKAGKLAAGYSASQDSLEKGRAVMVLYARDLSAGTRDKITTNRPHDIPEATILSRDEMGAIVNRELVGIIVLEDKGLADAVRRETERLKSLINNNG